MGAFLIWLAVTVLVVASMSKVFVKAGQPGWACIVPVYNMIVMLEIAEKPLWWIALFFIPVANFVASILVAISIAEHFGQGAGFGIGLAFLPFVFYPMLAFGSATYASTQAQVLFGAPAVPPPAPVGQAAVPPATSAAPPQLPVDET